MGFNMHAYVVERLRKATPQQWPPIAEGSGVPLRTLEKIAREYTKNPGVRHVQRVYDYFCRAEKRERPQ